MKFILEEKYKFEIELTEKELKEILRERCGDDYFERLLAKVINSDDLHELKQELIETGIEYIEYNLDDFATSDYRIDYTESVEYIEEDK